MLFLGVGVPCKGDMWRLGVLDDCVVSRAGEAVTSDDLVVLSPVLEEVGVEKEDLLAVFDGVGASERW